MDDLRDILVLFLGALIALALGILLWVGIRPPISYTTEHPTVTVCCPAGVHGSSPATTTTGAP